MTKEKQEKTNLYLLGIVGIVAIVGVVVLVFNSQINSIETDLFTTEGDITGEVASTSGCREVCGFNCKKLSRDCRILEESSVPGGSCLYKCV